jgi:two-component system, response regulator YesN
MARALRGVLRYRVYRQLVGSSLFLAIATIAALSLILFSLFSGSALKEISANSLELLERTAVAADILNDEVVTIGGHLVNELDIVSYLFAKRGDKMLDFNAMRVLDRTISVSTFIRSIGLSNGRTGEYYNNAGMRSRVPPERYAAVTGRFLPRVIPAEACPDRKAHAVLTRLFFPYAAAVGERSSAIELNVDERYLQSIIASLSGHAAGAVTMVLDPAGTVLSHDDPARFLSDASGLPWVRRILAAAPARGCFVASVDGERRLVTFVKSGRSGWAFVMSRPYAACIGNIERLKLITLLVALGLAILGVGLSALMTRAVHTPLRRLVERVVEPGVEAPGAGADGAGTAGARGKALDEYALIAETLARYDHTADELRGALRASLPLMRESWLQGLLTGEPREGIIPDATLAELDAGLAAPPYVVVTLRLDG